MTFDESIAFLRKAILCDLPFETKEINALKIVTDTALGINDLPLFDRLVGDNPPNQAFMFIDKILDWASVNFVIFRENLPTKPVVTKYDKYAIGPVINGYGPTVLIKHGTKTDKLSAWMIDSEVYSIGMISHGAVFLYAEMDECGYPEPFYEIFGIRQASPKSEQVLMDFKLRFC